MTGYGGLASPLAPRLAPGQLNSFLASRPATAGAALRAADAAPSAASAAAAPDATLAPHPAPAPGDSCNPRSANATANGCLKARFGRPGSHLRIHAVAAVACPLQCTAQSPDGCAQRFLCDHGCPVCKLPPANAACYGYRRVEVGQLDDLTSLSAKSVGNLTYWLVGSVLHATLDLREGALLRPLGLYVATSPPTGPPPQLDAQGNLRTDLVFGSGWDQLVLPLATCVSYAKDLAPLAYNDQVYVAVATSTCTDDGRCGCKGLWGDAGGSTCVLPPEIGKRLPTHSPSAYLKAPFQGCVYKIGRQCPPGFVGGDLGDVCLPAGGTCAANNTCGGGEWPAAQRKCRGFNPEGSDLSLTPRCANNAYDSMGYLTLDFTCGAAACQSDRDCALGYTCVTASPCLGDGGGCTQRCVPLAATFCADICPNALDAAERRHVWTLPPLAG
ncbi:hypothetical protein WJX81_006411 [Elliptochloris bilobata]|uniref:Uncharacterized protein n=1 Tax=Elliptochloris bilobata TaxID=381761 RepID=A0AAW1QZ71_9CHLO